MTRKRKSEPQPVELDILLHGVVTPEEVQDFFRRGEFYREGYLVAAIKRHLHSEADMNALARLGLSIEDCLNGRYGGDAETAVGEISVPEVGEVAEDPRDRIAAKAAQVSET